MWRHISLRVLTTSWFLSAVAYWLRTVVTKTQFPYLRLSTDLDIIDRTIMGHRWPRRLSTFWVGLARQFTPLRQLLGLRVSSWTSWLVYYFISFWGYIYLSKQLKVDSNTSELCVTSKISRPESDVKRRFMQCYELTVYSKAHGNPQRPTFLPAEARIDADLLLMLISPIPAAWRWHLLMALVTAVISTGLKRRLQGGWIIRHKTDYSRRIGEK